jgi:hypothetical protein
MKGEKKEKGVPTGTRTAILAILPLVRQNHALIINLNNTTTLSST